jgi:hypothetical protein
MVNEGYNKVGSVIVTCGAIQDFLDQCMTYQKVFLLIVSLRVLRHSIGICVVGPDT